MVVRTMNSSDRLRRAVDGVQDQGSRSASIDISMVAKVRDIGMRDSREMERMHRCDLIRRDGGGF